MEVALVVAACDNCHSQHTFQVGDKFYFWCECGDPWPTIKNIQIIDRYVDLDGKTIIEGIVTLGEE